MYYAVLCKVRQLSKFAKTDRDSWHSLATPTIFIQISNGRHLLSLLGVTNLPARYVINTRALMTSTTSDRSHPLAE